MLALLVGLLRILLVLLVIRLVGRFVSGGGPRLSRPGRGAGPGPRLASRELVRDRVCNTFVARDRALVATVDGEERALLLGRLPRPALAGARPKAMHHG